MTSLHNAIIAGVSALGLGAATLPAEAASPSSGKTIAGVNYSDIQPVAFRGGHGGGHGWGGGGGRGWGGGHYAGRGWGGGGRHWGGGGWGGPRYGYYRGYRHHNYGGYAAAGIVGLAAGAALAGPYGYGYDDDYYDRGGYGGRYGYSRAYYGGAECQVITRGRDYNGRPVRVIRYRPC
ncbi:hypothetical protein [Hansschlegelia plantiphila]|uniref:BA14K family protein n=1 Tax=Hansschlegelia plantiphila TaxID=374655 RepID=A0A9W6J4D8_9HYPH|nr:hypothetical protein [Hansschlegelia plantiphila]GLK69573.1 hypothetical protein GCM10008179_32110 [Hansschlegelia plantiphila]